MTHALSAGFGARSRRRDDAIAHRIGLVAAVAGAATLAVALSAAVAVRPAGASCAGPHITLDRPSVAVGGVLEIRGEAFGGCDDTGPPFDPMKPSRGIQLQVVQDDTATPLAQVDAAADARFVVRVAIPDSVAPGPATIGVAGSFGGAQPVVLTLRDPSGDAAAAAATPRFLVGRPSGTPSRATGTAPFLWGIAVGAGAVLVVGLLVVRVRRAR